MHVNTDQVDPVNKVLDDDAFRVIRGSGYYNYAQYCRSVCRDWDWPDLGYRTIGFRVILELSEEEFLRYARQYRSS
jgi:formylglycine-generating enzyme required for sulfatase activity